MGVEQIVKRLESGSRSQQSKVVIQQTAGVTAGEIREVIKANPGHPLSHIFSNAVGDKRDSTKLYVDRCDLLAIATNREVVRLQEDRDGVMVTIKQVGESLNKPAIKQPERPPVKTEQASE
jgi:hypothetical protein